MASEIAGTNPTGDAARARMVRKDGGIIWVSEAWTVVDDDGEGHRAFQGLVYDITERREAEEALRERSEQLSSIIETQRDVAAAELDLHSVMTLICERTRELTNAGGATILLFDGTGSSTARRRGSSWTGSPIECPWKAP